MHTLQPSDRWQLRARDLEIGKVKNTEGLIGAARTSRQPSNGSLSQLGSLGATYTQAAAMASLLSTNAPPFSQPRLYSNSTTRQSMASKWRLDDGSRANRSLGVFGVVGGQVVTPTPPSWQQLGLARGPGGKPLESLESMGISASNEPLRRRVISQRSQRSTSIAAAPAQSLDNLNTTRINSLPSTRATDYGMRASYNTRTTPSSAARVPTIRHSDALDSSLADTSSHLAAHAGVRNEAHGERSKESAPNDARQSKHQPRGDLPTSDSSIVSPISSTSSGRERAYRGIIRSRFANRSSAGLSQESGGESDDRYSNGSNSYNDDYSNADGNLTRSGIGRDFDNDRSKATATSATPTSKNAAAASLLQGGKQQQQQQPKKRKVKGFQPRRNRGEASASESEEEEADEDEDCD